jgi:YHS domain-containing protein
MMWMDWCNAHTADHDSRDAEEPACRLGTSDLLGGLTIRPAMPAGAAARVFSLLVVSGLMAALVLLRVPAVFGGQRADVEVTGPVEPSQVCMLNDFVITEQEGVPYVYHRKVYYFCCAGCIRRFAANPQVFSQAVDPVNEQEVDKATAPLYAVDGTVYYFSSGETLQAFAEDPMRYLQAGADPVAEGSRATDRGRGARHGGAYAQRNR